MSPYTASCGVCHCDVEADDVVSVCRWLAEHSCSPRTVPTYYRTTDEQVRAHVSYLLELCDDLMNTTTYTTPIHHGHDHMPTSLAAQHLTHTHTAPPATQPPSQPA